VRIHFRRTIDRLVGGVVSLISLGLLIAAWIKTQQQSRHGRQI
jgi:heme A synthase